MCKVIITTHKPNLYTSSAHLKASNNDYSMNVELSDAKTDLLHYLIWQGSV